MTWREVADEARGWLLDEEGPALGAYADAAGRDLRLPLVEIGGYCGKSACWIGAAAKASGTVLYSVDWHRGSPEMAPDRECHDPDMVGPDGFDTLPHFRRNIKAAGLEGWVIPVVGLSPIVGRNWHQPIGFLFIDGAHDGPGVTADYEMWAPEIVFGGYLLFHDTTIPEIGAVADRAEREGFQLVETVQSLRVLRKMP